MQRTFTLLFLLAACAGQGQDLTGVWQGHFRSSDQNNRSALIDDRYKFEVQIAQKDKLLEAVTYSYLSTLFYGKAAAAGTINPKTGKVLIQEGKLLEFRNMMNGGVCVMTCFLQFTRSGNEEFLEGTYVSMSTTDSSNCGRGNVFLRRVVNSDFYKEPFVENREKEVALSKKPPARTTTAPRAAAPAEKNPATAGTPTPPKKVSPGKPPAAAPVVKPAAPPPLARTVTPQNIQSVHPKDSGSSGNIGRKFAVIAPEVLTKRSNHVVQTITTHTNEITLSIYDDGVIDHDTVSIYLDKKLVVSRAMLTDRPIVLRLHMDEDDNFHELIMVAENEGEIPPNTSLMVVQAGEDRYEVRITSTEQKNAVVNFKFTK